MPFTAGSHRLLSALLSTKPLPAGSALWLTGFLPPADLIFFCWQEGLVFVLPERVPGLILMTGLMMVEMVCGLDLGAGTGQQTLGGGFDRVGDIF